jgi:hypothetical protein
MTLVFDIHTKNLNLGYNFYILNTRASIFLLSIPCDKTYPWTHIFYPVTWTLVFDLHIENSNRVCVFWISCTRTLIFCMCFLWQILSVCTKRFDLVTLTIMFDLHVFDIIFKSFNNKHGCQWNLSLSTACVLSQARLVNTCNIVCFLFSLTHPGIRRTCPQDKSAPRRFVLFQDKSLHLQDPSPQDIPHWRQLTPKTSHT